MNKHEIVQNVIVKKKNKINAVRAWNKQIMSYLNSSVSHILLCCFFCVQHCISRCYQLLHSSRSKTVEKQNLSLFFLFYLVPKLHIVLPFCSFASFFNANDSILKKQSHEERRTKCNKLNVMFVNHY